MSQVTFTVCVCVCVQTTPINFELDSRNTTYSTLSDLRIDRTWKKGGTKSPTPCSKIQEVGAGTSAACQNFDKKKTAMVMRGLWASR